MKIIHSYNYRPDPNFIGKARNQRYFGVEIECYDNANYFDEGRVTRKLLYELEQEKGFTPDDLFYLKSDSSLNEAGFAFEIVTHPFSFAYMKSKNLFKGFDKCKIHSFKKRSTGIHIHVSRKSVSELALAKMLYFFSLPENMELLVKIAQRDWNTYTQKHKKGEMKQHLRGYKDRYQAINLQNSRTIEFRMFKGNVKPEAITRAVEFCESFINFCSTHSAHKMKAEYYIEYVNSVKTGNGPYEGYKYFNLRTFLKKKNNKQENL